MQAVHADAGGLRFFGEKDFQQVQVIRRMVADLDLPIEIVACPTRREADGLARSSRNRRLTPMARQAAAVLPRVLAACARDIAMGTEVAAALGSAAEQLADAGFAPVDYIELRAEQTWRLFLPCYPARPRACWWRRGWAMCG